MILVDSSVWIAFFNGHATAEADYLDRLLGSEPLLIGDLILAEVLQGFRRDAHYHQAKALLDILELRVLGGKDVAVTAADNFRRLRRAGITPRKTIDMIIGTYCIIHGLELLHADRDFDVLRQKLGLRVVEP